MNILDIATLESYTQESSALGLTIDFNDFSPALNNIELTTKNLPVTITNFDSELATSDRFLNLFQGIFNGGFGGYWHGDALTVTVVTGYDPSPANDVPEPSSIFLMMTFAAAMALISFKKKVFA